MDAATLASELSQFTGTENWYRHPLARSVTYTDGVKYFADEAGAHWFLDILATELPPLVRKHEFLSILLHVVGTKAEATATDGNSKTPLWSRKFGFTDCPPGDWRFFMTPGGPRETDVILIPSEY